MNFREITFVDAEVKDIPRTEESYAREEHILLCNNNMRIVCSIDERSCIEDGAVQHFTLKAELDGNAIGIIAGAVFPFWDILNSSEDVFIYCDGDDDLLGYLYIQLLKHVVPMEYIKLYPSLSREKDLNKAKAISAELEAYLDCMSDQTPFFLLVNCIYIEEQYRGSGLLRLMTDLLGELFVLCGMAVSINPLKEESRNEENKAILVYSSSEREQERMIQIAKHLGFDIHDDPLQDESTMKYVVAVKSSDHIKDILRDEDFKDEVDYLIKTILKIMNSSNIENHEFQ